MTDKAWPSIVSSYAQRFHAHVGPDHHVVSPLGAWILVALCAPMASGVTWDELSQVLGADPDEAALFAAALMSPPHRAVAAAAGLWVRPRRVTESLRRWAAGLPPSVDTGDLPVQSELDAWARERTLGLIDRFPIGVRPETVCLLATALATRVSWSEPFQVEDASALGAGPWPARLESVLRAPEGDPRHRQFLCRTEEAGVMAVHLAQAREGLVVGSVIAADADRSPLDVLAVAHDIVCGEALRFRSTIELSLFDLPAQGPVWSIREEQVQTRSSSGREEFVTSILPAWTAQTETGLADDALGLPGAARALAGALGIPHAVFDAAQSAVARYDAVGFEAGAVTGLAVATSAPPPLRPGIRRSATVRFNHPYAAVAAAVSQPGKRQHDPWVGLPVFSAWVSEPTEAVQRSPAR